MWRYFFVVENFTFWILNFNWFSNLSDAISHYEFKSLIFVQIWDIEKVRIKELKVKLFKLRENFTKNLINMI